jgi:rfaE bifunctional protein nucleotidyltransferase chain/domain
MNELLHELKNSGKRVVFTNGCFDILHAGHLKLLRFCKDHGDIVVVGLNSDNSVRRLKGETRPINTFNLRRSALESVGDVDFVVGFDEDTPIEIIKELRPSVLVKGGDYTPESVVGREYAGETLICDLVDGMSSSAIINTKKTIIHVWSHDFCNQVVTPTSYRFGIGDLLRGSIGMIQYCEQRGYDCIIDISLHPLSQIFEVKPHRFSELIQLNRGNIRGIFPRDVDEFVKDELSKNDVIFFFTNFGTDVFDRPISPLVSHKIQEVLTLRQPAAHYVASRMALIPWADFSVLHVRLGDDDIIENKVDIKYTEYLNKIRAVTTSRQVLISDSIRFKRKAKSLMRIFAFDEQPSHLGFHTNANDLIHTVFEFLLLTRANHIITYSVYDWISGFVRIANYVFKIPLYKIN